MVDPASAATVGVGLAAVYGLGAAAKDLLIRALGPAADAVGEHFGARVSSYLTQNGSTVANRAAEMVKESGREVRSVPLRTMLPLLEGASREDDPALQERWAALLANAATAADAEQIPPILAATLRELTPFAAAVLDAVADEIRAFSADPAKNVGIPRWGASKAQISERMGVPNDARLEFAVDVLVRQNLLEREAAVRVGVHPDHEFMPPTDYTGDFHHMVLLTALGVRFLRACRPPMGH